MLHLRTEGCVKRSEEMWVMSTKCGGQVSEEAWGVRDMPIAAARVQARPGDGQTGGTGRHYVELTCGYESCEP